MAFTGLLAGLSQVPSIRASQTLFWSVLGASACLLAFTAVLRVLASGRVLRFTFVPRAQHYLQASMQAAVYAYWGYYWRPVYDAVPLIAAQLAFAYAFDMLLTWSRRDEYTLGFGPFPVIFSTNLFLWFKPEWFYLQFLMVAVGFAAKELIRWDKDGRRAHIFNPSSFPLSVFSIALILTGATSMTWGIEIATTQFNPPNIYVLLFLVGLPGQILFGVTTMTMSAVVTTYVLGLAWFAATGTYYFIDSYIPVAVFLGMHLLFTDPSTAPRTELGRLIFGGLYGASVFALYFILERAGIPSFYDKLLPVPLLNLSIKGIDRLAQSSVLQVLDPSRLGRTLRPRQRNLAYVAIWTVVFVGMTAADGVGDSHPGHRVPFWRTACETNLTNGCSTLGLITQAYCQDGSGWACNELGVLLAENRVSRDGTASQSFDRACELGFAAGCANAVRVASGDPPQRAPVQLRDYPVVLRSGKGAIPEQTPLALHGLACEQGWMEGCEGLGGLYLLGQGVVRDPGRAAAEFDKACTGGLASACSNLGFMYYSADGVPLDKARGLALLKRSCELGFAEACRWYEETAGKADGPT
ncbi:MAG: tetratricopeptide repeat protein [Vicinamibacterales bacterium]